MKNLTDDIIYKVYDNVYRSNDGHKHVNLHIWDQIVDKIQKPVQQLLFWNIRYPIFYKVKDEKYHY